MTAGPLEAFVHRFEPAADPAGARTLLLLHGTGGDENDLVPLGRLLDPRAALLAPRGQVLENGMPRFFRRIAEGVFDLDDLRARTAGLGAFVRAAAERHRFDPARLVAVGFSNGANIAASLLLLEPGALAAAVLFRAMVPLEPGTRPGLAGTPVFLAAGRADPLVPAEETGRLADLLAAAGAEVTVNWAPGGHALAPSEVEAARAWLARHAARPA
jgi:phospholipase/carboxylesterase/glyoxalase family protein